MNQVGNHEMVERFVSDGFVKIEGAFPSELAERGREILWRQIGLSPDDPSGWTKQVVWAYDESFDPVFDRAANTPRLHEAFDALVGPGRWAPRREVGMFPIRFPVDPPDDDRGWHIDGSIDRGDGTYAVNLRSQGRALLMLFLFSDVGPDDAPTRIRVGSHLDVPGVLEPFGEEGAEFFTLGPLVDAASAHRPVAHATGRAGEVFLCHPFLVHAAREHTGTRPRFMSQPALPLKEPLALDRPDGDYSPVERAVRLGLRASGRAG
ncbi:phytanoyl-CoA dioxygenase family protein [Planobispora longispora]|uniref:Phytanoyl-CoA dioxygenase n=1 Tax=Planobispora longispora TaxID=28887 RepID=A0A8J3RLZ4_9ACTN|nr:phytanoyl-CoA dioxygenase family protein [Planobispora longispora]GIH78127.1 phytanoyl-CoA dioxygenase [Planobispora longispora]